jgi:FlaA1/EpsC-like NDP-sugar epimerase
MASPISNPLTYQLVTLKRTYKRAIMLCADVCALPLALWSAYALRLSEWWPEEYLSAAGWLFVLVPIVGIVIFVRLGLYRAVVRFMGAQAIWAVVKGVSLLALLLWAMAFVFQVNPFPRSIPINFALVALVYVGGSRLMVRHYYHWLLRYRLDKKAVLIYGAGGAGVQLATALSDGREYYPVGFIDDDSALWQSTIKSLPVYSSARLDDIVEQENVTHVLLALPHASNKQRKAIIERLSPLSVHVQTIPSMPDLLSGNASVEQLREVDIEDLLGRDPVPAIPALLSKCITNKVVLVSGAGGSIGSELCRQIMLCQPKQLILLEQSEFNLYQIEKELLNNKLGSQKVPPIIALLGSVVDRQKMKSIYECFSIDTVYHAAAYKHVPLVEKNIIEGVSNNVFGTQVIAEEAAAANVSHFILVSTDKAVRPTNVMGATKRFAEMVLQSLALQSDTVFSMVRFGNVLGSSGSVVPLFRQQIASGGPITVTHQEITRFFMTIPEAASLVIQAGSMAEGGDVFVLDMGGSVKIADLATRMVQLSGLEVKSKENPDGDIEIQFTGLRPAEKLYEELLLGDNVTGTQHSKIMRANESCLAVDELAGYIEKLHDAIARYDVCAVKDVLCAAVAGYQPHKELVDYLTPRGEKAADGNIINLR